MYKLQCNLSIATFAQYVAVYNYSLLNWLFERGCISILVAINTGFLDCIDGVYICSLEMQQYPPLSVV